MNPKARSIHSFPAFPSVDSIPDEIDLAVVVVPKEYVLDVVDECGAKGVPAVVVISAGFKEVGGEGIELEARLMEKIREHGMRLVGPNCMGLLNTSAEVSMNATFAPTMPPIGPTSFMSQSGALGVTILDYAAEYGIGIHHFISVGNKPDVSANDLLEFWEDDPGTGVILMYLESFGNPRHFTQIARRVSKKKPIAVVKSGRTAAGARAASSHTGALAGADVAADALLAQCGIYRAGTIEELFDVAMAFGSLPFPEGNRVAIVGNAGGPGIIIADACESAGLDIVDLDPSTEAKLQEKLPEEASVRNPVDMIASATSQSYKTALEIVLADPNVDAIIASFVPPLGVSQIDVAECIVEAYQTHRDKPILAVLMGREGLPQGRAELAEVGIPAYIFPEAAARALAAMNRYREWLERPVMAPEVFEVDGALVEEILDRVVASGRENLLETEALEVFEAYGIPTVPHRLANTEAEAVEAGEAIGFPLVLKVVSQDVVHKTDVGGVRVDVRTAQELKDAFRALLARVEEAVPDARIEGVLIESYEKEGTETIIGMTNDPKFGPVLMFGLGGIYVEALGDVAFRIQPVCKIDAEEMIHSIRGFPLLEGVRGEEGADLEALAEVIQRVSQLVGDHHRIAELDINPFLSFPKGGVAVDARIRVELPEPSPQASF